MLEIQATISSTPEQPSKMPMWCGVMVAYAIVPLYYFSVAFGGYYAFGNSVDPNILITLDKPRWLIALANLMVVVHVIGSYRVFAMPVFDMMDTVLVKKLKFAPGLPLRLTSRSAYFALKMFIGMTKTDDDAAAGGPGAAPDDDGRRRGRGPGRRGGVRAGGPAADGGAGGGVVRVQHRGAAAQQVPPLRLRLPVPGLPHRVPHVRVGAALLRLRRRRHLRLPPAALARAGGQGGRAGRRLLRLRGRRQRLAALPPRLLQPGRRRHHALLHRAHRLRRRRPPRGPRHLRRPPPRRRRRRHRHRGGAELPSVRVHHVRGRDGGEGAQDRAAGDPALLRRGEAQLHGPAAVHGAGGGGAAGAGNADDGAGRARRGGGARPGGPQLRVDADRQLLAGLPGEPDQLPGHQAHQPAHPPGARERERRCRRRGLDPDIQEPGDRHGDAGLRGDHRRRGSVRRGQEEEQVNSAVRGAILLLFSQPGYPRRYADRNIPRMRIDLSPELRFVDPSSDGGTMKTTNPFVYLFLLQVQSGSLKSRTW